MSEPSTKFENYLSIPDKTHSTSLQGLQGGVFLNPPVRGPPLGLGLELGLGLGLGLPRDLFPRPSYHYDRRVRKRCVTHHSPGRIPGVASLPSLGVAAVPWRCVACDGGSGSRRRRGNAVVALTPLSLSFVTVTVFCCFVSPHQHHLVRHHQSSSSSRVGINTIKKKERESFTVVVDDVRANCDVGMRE